MAKGIIRVINTYNHSEVAIIASENMQETINKFEDGIMPTRGLERYPHKDNLKLEVIEETKELASRYAFYTWPKLERVSYSPECMNKSLEKGFSTKVKNAVDWLIEMYADKKYSFVIDVEREMIVGIVLENKLRSEKITFKKKNGEPFSREFIG